ncbi:MAG TPA: hypothetical protein VGO37_06930 [Steroidobacteraceae bacterium]|jgi:hypothetical protein|nr:hypothetical protein [Steroidobacteraceae bacterium]
MLDVQLRKKIPFRLRKALAFGALPLLLSALPAFGDDGVSLIIANDGIEDIFVTVYDMSAKPYIPVMDHARINGFTKVPLFVTADDTGRANLYWSAISVDDRDRQCGHETKVGLDGDALVSVHADSACGGG